MSGPPLVTLTRLKPWITVHMSFNQKTTYSTFSNMLSSRSEVALKRLQKVSQLTIKVFCSQA